ncbi:MAG: hypothetical protein EBV03_12350, partial [Proteobacteria bacterium]|nr:hypothetical protein [Pseudomonadota bacterium]
MQPALIRRDRRAIILWLAVCALFVALMVLVGGYTRLSGSGMSITQWKPIHGFIPPLTPTGKSALVPPMPWHYSGALLTVEYRTDPA